MIYNQIFISVESHTLNKVGTISLSCKYHVMSVTVHAMTAFVGRYLLPRIDVAKGAIR